MRPRKIALFPLLTCVILALCTVFASCDLIGKKPVYPAEAGERALAFEKEVGGTWTADDGSFVDFGVFDGTPRASFGVWDSDGEFPAGEIMEAEKKSEGSYVITLRMMDSGDDTKYDCAFADRQMTLTTGGISKVYRFDPSRQRGNAGYPKAVAPADFANEFLGTWTSSDDNFVDFDVEETGDGKRIPCVMFATWNSGGDFPAGEITEVSMTSADRYEFTVKMASDGSNVKYALVPDRSGSLTVSFADGSSEKFTYDGTRQYPVEYTDITNAEALKTFGDLRLECKGGKDLMFMEERGGRLVIVVGEKRTPAYQREAIEVKKIVRETNARTDRYTVTASDGQITKDLTFEFVQAGEILEISDGNETVDYRLPTADELKEMAHERALAFVNRFKGTWTADDGRFIDLEAEELVPTYLMGIWSGEFANLQSEIVDAVENEADVYTLYLKGGDPDKPIEYTVKSEGGSLRVTYPSETVVYTYYGTKQFPQEFTPVSNARALAVFGGPYTGYRDDNKVLYMTESEGNLFLVTGNWSDPEQQRDHDQVFSLVSDDSSRVGRYLADVRVFTEDGYAMRKYVFEFAQAGYVLEVDFGDGHPEAYREYTPAGEAGQAAERALAFANAHSGQWTAPDTEFIHVGVTDGIPGAMIAIMNAGGPFPAATITDAKKTGGSDGTEIWDVEITEVTGRRTTWKCVFRTYSDGLKTLTTAVADGTDRTYVYYPDIQYPREVDYTTTDTLILDLGRETYWFDYAHNTYLTPGSDGRGTMCLRLGSAGGTAERLAYPAFVVKTDAGPYSIYTVICTIDGSGHIIYIRRTVGGNTLMLFEDDPGAGFSTYTLGRG